GRRVADQPRCRILPGEVWQDRRRRHDWQGHAGRERKVGMTEKGASRVPRVKVRVMRLAHGKDLPLPEYHSEAAAGMDLLAAVDWDEPLTLTPGARTLVPTGLVLELPPGFEGQVRPRSGMAPMNGVTVLNSPGTIDADYRGEVRVLLANLSGV